MNISLNSEDLSKLLKGEIVDQETDDIYSPQPQHIALQDIGHHKLSDAMLDAFDSFQGPLRDLAYMYLHTEIVRRWNMEERINEMIENAPESR